MQPVRILVLGDLQNGFIRKNGNLYIQGADQLINPINRFLSQIVPSDFDYIFIILDTHFSEEYHLTEEGRQFPIHCEYGTTDWQLAIDIPVLPNILYFLKNSFTMWGEKKCMGVSFANGKRKRAHESLYHFVDNPYTVTHTVPRDKIITSLSDSDHSGIDVTLIGVASDYCNRYAMEGWLKHNARVTIIEDLTKGIEKETAQILEEEIYKPYIQNQLRAVTQAQYLKELQTLHTRTY